MPRGTRFDSATLNHIHTHTMKKPTPHMHAKPSRKTSEKAIAKQEKAKAEVALMPPVFELLHGNRAAEWIESLEAPEVSVAPEDEEAARDVVAAAVEEWNRKHEGDKEKKPFAILPSLAKFGNAFAALLGGVVRGLKQDDWMARSGISWSRAQMLSRVDKDGFGVLWHTAWRMRDETSSRRVHENAVKRALDGDEVPLVGRIEKDKDGIIGHRKQYSDRLTEYLMEETKSREERVSAPLVDASTKTTQIVGQQIIYKLPELPSWLPTDVKKKPETIDAEVVEK